MSLPTVPCLIICAAYVGLDASLATVAPALFGRIPYPLIISSLCWITINMLMTSKSGPSVPGSLLLLSALINLARGLCLSSFVDDLQKCQALLIVPPQSAPALLAVAISIMFKRWKYVSWTWAFMFAAWVSLLGAVHNSAGAYTPEPVKTLLVTRPWLPLALSSTGWLLGGLLMMRSSSPPPPTKIKRQ